MPEPETLPKIRVMIVDDHPVVRVGLRALVDAQPDMRVVAEAADGDEAVAAFARAAPDITLMDLRLPRKSGPEAIAEIRKIAPRAHIIVLTTYDGDVDVFRAVQAGARGYLLKGTFPEGMIEAIRNVHAGGELIAPEVAAKLREHAGERLLTSREVGVLELVAKGLSNKEIAGALLIAEDTVKNHLKHIYEKLGVNDRTEAALLAVQRGFLHL
jgi:DNA-binding NarL/FixJ family response regulator